MEKKSSKLRTAYVLLTVALAVIAFNLYPESVAVTVTTPPVTAFVAAPPASEQPVKEPVSEPSVIEQPVIEEPVIEQPVDEPPIADTEIEQPTETDGEVNEATEQDEQIEPSEEITVPYTAWINGDDVNVRAKPSRDAKIVVVLDRGSVVKVKAVEDEWRLITIGEVEGYVYYEFVAAASAQTRP